MRPISLLDRYIIRGFTYPFLFCVFGFTIILLSGILFELTDFIFVKNVAISLVGKMLLYKLPEMVVLTLPIAVLFATLLSLGKLQSQSELTVMRCSGVPFRRIIVPILIIAFVVSVVTYQANERVVPWANHQFENIVRKLIFEDGIPVVQENVFFHGGEGRFFYIQEVTRYNELKNVMIYELEQSGPFPRLITAKGGVFHDKVWILRDGIIQEMDEEGFVNFETRFETLEIVTEENAELYFGNQRTTDEMNRRELREHIERFRRGGLNVRSFEVDYHMKLTLPAASLIFAFFGAPLVLKGKGGSSYGIAVSIVIIFLYYVITPVCRSLGVNGVFEPLVAAWFPNALFGISGLALVFNADRLR